MRGPPALPVGSRIPSQTVRVHLVVPMLIFWFIAALLVALTLLTLLWPLLRARPLATAPDAEALGPRLRDALQGDEIVLLKASRGAALERVLRHLN